MGSSFVPLHPAGSGHHFSGVNPGRVVLRARRLVFGRVPDCDQAQDLNPRRNPEQLAHRGLAFFPGMTPEPDRAESKRGRGEENVLGRS